MIVLENVLTGQELAAVREFLQQAEWVDGKATADADIRDNASRR